MFVAIFLRFFRPLRNDGSLNTQALADEASAMFEDLNNTAASALFEDIYPSIQRYTVEYGCRFCTWETHCYCVKI